MVVTSSSLELLLLLPEADRCTVLQNGNVGVGLAKESGGAFGTSDGATKAVIVVDDRTEKATSKEKKRRGIMVQQAEMVNPNTVEIMKKN